MLSFIKSCLNSISEGVLFRNLFCTKYSKSFSDIRANPYIDQPHRRIMELTIEFKLY